LKTGRSANTATAARSVQASYTAGVVIAVLGLILLLIASPVTAKIYIDINAPSLPKLKIAIPDFKNLSDKGEHPELSARLSQVVAGDLDLSGYFLPLDKESYLEGAESPLTLEEIRFKNWSVLGAELLLRGAYTCVGSRLEVEIRLFDVIWGRQIMGKRVLGEVAGYRRVMHRVGNEIIRKLTGHEGIFLTRLAFVGTMTGHKEIYTCDYDGRNLKRVTWDRSIALLPRWSPDGKRLLYNSYRDGGPMLFMRDMVSGKVRRLSGRKGLNIGAAWLPDGKRLALTLSRRGNPDIFLIDLNGKILDRLTKHWAIDVSPTFSPDGKKMAFVSSRSGSPQIYVRNLSDGREERLTFEGGYNTSPAWSSRNRIAFVSMDGGRFEIYAMDPDGTGLRKLTDGTGNNEDPCWSPDGRYIVFSSNREGSYHLYLMNANGQNQRKIVSLKGDQTAPSWVR